MSRFIRTALRSVLMLAVFAAIEPGVAATDPQPDSKPDSTPVQKEQAMRSTLIQGCWSDADKGDSADTKLAFRASGALIQYDENQQDQHRRTFGAWEMQKDSTFLVVYWPNGAVTRYNVKRIGPILHFTGLFGVRNFTMREIAAERCWTPKE